MERFFNVDSDWLIGWAETIFNSSFRPGFYNDPVVGGFNAAFFEATKRSKFVKNQAILWSAEPELGVSGKRNAPRFNPKEPTCHANVWGWQYGRNSTLCPVDTVLADHRLFVLMH